MGSKDVEEKEGKGTLEKKKDKEREADKIGQEERAVHAPSRSQARGYSGEKQQNRMPTEITADIDQWEKNREEETNKTCGVQNE